MAAVSPARRTALARAGLVAGGALVIAVVLAFLLLPIIALLTYQPLDELLNGLDAQVTLDAIGVSLKTNAIAFGITVLLGTPFAYILARHRFPGRSAVITLVELPLVMPPAVAGLGLLAAFGRLGLLGSELQVLGIDLAFTQAAVVLAIMFVAGPVLSAWGDRRVRGDRRECPRRRRDPRGGPAAADAARRRSAGKRRARCGGGGKLRAGHG